MRSNWCTKSADVNLVVPRAGKGSTSGSLSALRPGEEPSCRQTGWRHIPCSYRVLTRRSPAESPPSRPATRKR